MNVLVDRMVQEGLLDESAARGLSGLLASGESPTRAFAACGLAEEPLLRFWTRQFGYPYVELEQEQFSKQFLAQFPARVLLDKHVIPVEGTDSEVLPGWILRWPWRRWPISIAVSNGTWASGPTRFSR